MQVLGLETSCDETAAAVIKFNSPANGEILSDVVYSQLQQHKPYGGVVPELASRAHQQNIIPVVDRAIKEAKINKINEKHK